MTNLDLEAIYEILIDIRFRPERKNNPMYLEKMLLELRKDRGISILSNEWRGWDKDQYKKEYYVFIPAPYTEISVKDEAVYKFFEKFLLELKYLCLTQRYKRVFWLIDYLHNFPEEILKNNLTLPVKKLKSCLKPYWRKFDKSFLKREIANNFSTLEKFELYQKVRLLNGKYSRLGLRKGMTGTILEQYDEDHFEIEWYDNNGNVVNSFSFEREDFELL